MFKYLYYLQEYDNKHDVISAILRLKFSDREYNIHVLDIQLVLGQSLILGPTVTNIIRHTEYLYIN